ncbi:hypothetical protein GCM10028775_47910 [Catellatospora paridis]
MTLRHDPPAGTPQVYAQTADLADRRVARTSAGFEGGELRLHLGSRPHMPITDGSDRERVVAPAMPVARQAAVTVGDRSLGFVTDECQRVRI